MPMEQTVEWLHDLRMVALHIVPQRTPPPPPPKKKKIPKLGVPGLLSPRTDALAFRSHFFFRACFRNPGSSPLQFRCLTRWSRYTFLCSSLSLYPALGFWPALWPSLWPSGLPFRSGPGQGGRGQPAGDGGGLHAGDRQGQTSTAPQALQAQARNRPMRHENPVHRHRGKDIGTRPMLD